MVIDDASDEAALMQFHQEQVSIAKDDFSSKCNLTYNSDLDAKYQQNLLDRLQDRYYKWKSQFWEDISQHLMDQIQRRSNEIEHAELENVTAQDRIKVCCHALQRKCEEIREAEGKILDKLDNPRKQRRVQKFINEKVQELVLARAKLTQEESRLEENRELLRKGHGKLKKAEQEINEIQATARKEIRCTESHDNSSIRLTEEQNKRLTSVKNASRTINEVDADLLCNQQGINNTNKLIDETTEKSSKFLNYLLMTIGLAFGILIALCAAH